MNKAKGVFLGAAILIIAIILFFGGVRGTRINEEPISIPIATSTPGEITRSGITASGGDFTVERIDEPDGSSMTRPIPDIKRPVKYSSDLSAGAKRILTDRIADLGARLSGKPSSYADWFDLGLAYKMAGDFIAAKDAWEYAVFLYDQDAVVYANLGDLYGYYLKDTAMAEVNFLKAIELEPMVANWYVKAANFYREVAQNPEKAASVLARGLAELPNDPSLKGALEKLSE